MGVIASSDIMKALPPIERLNELFSYDSLTGVVTRKCNTGKLRNKGHIVGTNNDGHLRVCVDRSYYQLHRIVWKLHTGDDPSPYEIDHINRIRDDNRIDNLRLVTTQNNLKNKSVYSTNKSGFPNVFKRGKRYMASIRHNGDKTYLGSFNTAQEAHNAVTTFKSDKSFA